MSAILFSEVFGLGVAIRPGRLGVDRVAQIWLQNVTLVLVLGLGSIPRGSNPENRQHVVIHVI